MNIYDPPLPTEPKQCRVCDTCLEQDWAGQWFCPKCERGEEEEEVSDEASYL
jgi:uncharacterized Zn finger protein (UPF0148 family)